MWYICFNWRHNTNTHYYKLQLIIYVRVPSCCGTSSGFDHCMGAYIYHHRITPSNSSTALETPCASVHLFLALPSIIFSSLLVTLSVVWSFARCQITWMPWYIAFPDWLLSLGSFLLFKHDFLSFPVPNVYSQQGLEKEELKVLCWDSPV